MRTLTVLLLSLLAAPLAAQEDETRVYLYRPTDLRAGPSDTAEVTREVRIKQSFLLQDCEPEWCLLHGFRGTEYWIKADSFVTSMDDPRREWEEIEAAERARRAVADREIRARRNEAQEEYRNRVVRILQEAGLAEAAAAYMDGEPAIGMPPQLVRDVWGEPESINTTTTALGEREQWVYGSGRYVYFEDGMVTAIQDSR